MQRKPRQDFPVTSCCRCLDKIVEILALLIKSNFFFFFVFLKKNLLIKESLDSLQPTRT